jgi:hypothetical protein
LAASRNGGAAFFPVVERREMKPALVAGFNVSGTYKTAL